MLATHLGSLQLPSSIVKLYACRIQRALRHNVQIMNPAARHVGLAWATLHLDPLPGERGESRHREVFEVARVLVVVRASSYRGARTRECISPPRMPRQSPSTARPSQTRSPAPPCDCHAAAPDRADRRSGHSACTRGWPLQLAGSLGGHQGGHLVFHAHRRNRGPSLLLAALIVRHRLFKMVLPLSPENIPTLHCFNTVNLSKNR